MDGAPLETRDDTDSDGDPAAGGYGRPQWSADSTFVAWLTTDRTPTLVVVETEPPEGEDGSHIVELAGVGADPSPATSFLLDATLSRR